MWFRGILFIFVFFISCFFLGDFFLDFLNWERKIIPSVIWGAVLLLSVLEIVAYPLYRLNQSFSLFYLLFSLILIIILALSFIKAIRRNNFVSYKNDFSRLITGVKSVPFLFAVLCIIILFYLIYVFAFYYPTTDDGYYMTRSMEVIKQNTLGINVRTAWLGWSDSELPDYTDSSTFAFFISYISALFGIQVTILCKTFLAFCLVLLHLGAVVLALDAVMEDKTQLFSKKAVAITLYIIFQIFSVKASSAGIWMTGYIWNGKSLLPGFIFPLLLATCFTLMRHVDSIKKREWLSVLLIMLAGVAVSIVGLNLPLILYFSFGTAFLLVTKFKSFKKIWLQVFLSILPVLIIALLSYLFVITGQNDYYESGVTNTINWKDQFLEAIDFFQFILYLFSLIYLLTKGSFLQKALLVLAPIILLLSFLNPFLVGPVCRYVTTSLVYWRLWWLFPIYLLPAVVITDIIAKLSKGNLQAGFFCSLISVFLVSGFQLFRYAIIDPDYTIIPFVQNTGKLINARPELRYNLYGINSATYETAKAVLQDWNNESPPRLLMYFNRPYEIRQYSTDIIMVPAIRDIQLSDNPLLETGLTENHFMQTYSEIDNGQLVRKILDFYSVDYICFEGHPGFRDPEQFGFRFVSNTGGIDLWRVIR